MAPYLVPEWLEVRTLIWTSKNPLRILTTLRLKKRLVADSSSAGVWRIIGRVGRPSRSTSEIIYHLAEVKGSRSVSTHRIREPFSSLCGLANEKINENVTVRIYKPKNSEAVLPIGVFCHGGGFSDGSIDMEDGLCRVIASMCPCIIVSVDYRLATVVDIKVVFQDAFDGFSWVSKCLLLQLT